ncbi:small ubiquitin-related modifier-like [Rhopalosiphum padi]|uniref:small ubiquitin-related modifier-like n=1 Tax=Rhopalosiphum padi TaxID=40932 RepID=UPI00298D6C47|nr:small ubiquitin-related modifier-like [Rhopalosiphum padi]
MLALQTYASRIASIPNLFVTNHTIRWSLLLPVHFTATAFSWLQHRTSCSPILKLISEMAKNKGNAGELISLRLEGLADDFQMQFRINKDASFKWLLEMYSKRIGTNKQFFYDGKLISETDTPESLEMEEEGTIEVHNAV